MQFDSDISTLVQARLVRIAIAWKKVLIYQQKVFPLNLSKHFIDKYVDKAK